MKRGRSFMKYRNGSRDKNHAAITKGLRTLGYLVVDLAGAGDGVPDVLVFSRTGALVFIEFKTAKGKLRASQVAFAERLTSYDVRHGVARTLDEALALVGHDARLRAVTRGDEVERRIAEDVARLEVANE